MQRDIVQRPGTNGASTGAQPAARTSLPGNLLAPAAGRRFVAAALAEWSGLGLPAAVGFSERLADDAAVVVSELVTNAVVHAGTNVELLFRLEEATEDEAAALVLEISDHHPARAVRSDGSEGGFAGAAGPGEPAEYGRGLELVATLAERWGITYRTGLKTVWARLPVDDWNPFPDARPEPGFQQGLRAAELLAPTARRALRDDADWAGRGALSFLAEASDLLAGQLDEDIVAALAGQLLVPRLADWCAIWLEPETPGRAAVPRLAKVWHVDETRIQPLRTLLEGDPLRLPERVGTGPVSIPWPGSAEDDGQPDGLEGVALAYRITSGGRTLGAVLLGREGIARVPDEVTALIEDFVRRVGLAVGAARAYTRQATISRILQRGLLPSKVADIPGVVSSLVYEPSDDGVVGGDFYDIFPCPNDRWCFVLGDVQGSGPEAAVVTGLARPWLRLLAREGFQADEVLVRLNRLLLDDAMEAAEAAALMVAAAGGQHSADSGQSRFLSLLYGELVPLPGGGARCTLVSAGHPLPLLLRPDGSVRPAAEPQLLLGVMDDAVYETQSFDLAPGDSLLCVTDGVTERRSGPLMFDDEDGLAQALSGCAGLSAEGIADRIKHAVHAFAERPPDDDLALLVLQAE
ncbi:SpoIIE family protein phosphatase [Streptomyces poriferorum]|uniref:SpoIIE family protein phosphatase n=1 Tax=Streptomyces poriferorum TaxID=2798799 RepID=A0ABY9J1Y4_9ACTN|nr:MULTISPECIES: SpoIIE family protein phosphatase [Streptomyces]MBW5253931.1 SpoIIE family protein phosphatase [Streptomyces poriferorum]MBW5261636.1 SpoIIE family protein phosphatase [Streptomyces poriferorum]MDP5311863.1 SpoIIE family protein phosphatase [Streptomyces sp. Alt4]WLQ53319.1 SpoIIE family protein phosphatase [Streptomyces sp. Alt1]WLQ61835.1 SpoIIE family protein phosphatase [Streptomyces sp. Alt2]